MSFSKYFAYKDCGVDWLGPVPTHWETWKLRHAFDGIGSGTTPPTAEPHWYEEGTIPWVTTGELRETAIYQTTKSITPEALQQFTTLKVHPKGSLAIAMYGATIGRLGLFGINATTNQACCVLSEPRTLDVRFVFYWLQGFKKRIIDLYATGGGQPNINQETISSLRIPAPALAEQSVIVAFLDHETAKIDGLIAEQEKLLTLLAEKRQATISHAVTKGLNPDVPKKDSGVEWLGEVPEHWMVKQLKHVARPGTSITYGIVQAGPHFEGGVPYIKTSDMSGDELPLDGYSLTSPEIDSSYSRSKVETGDIVIAIRATVGKCLSVPPELTGANLTQGTAKVSPGESVSPIFLLAALRSSSAQNYFDSVAKGATFREITLDALRRTPVAVPPLDEQDRIMEVVTKVTSQMNDLMANTTNATRLLKERRSALVSAAVTGQIDVRNAAPEATTA